MSEAVEQSKQVEAVAEDIRQLHWYCVSFQYSSNKQAASVGHRCFGIHAPAIRNKDLESMKADIIHYLSAAGHVGVDAVILAINFLGVMTAEEFNA